MNKDSDLNLGSQRVLRPTVRFLSDELRDQIISEGRGLICELGVEVHNESVVKLLVDGGASIDSAGGRICFTEQMIDRALGSVPGAFKLYDTSGREAVDFSESIVNFTPGSAAINLLDPESGVSRRPVATDYVRYSKLMCRMDHIASQSTAMIPSDVHEQLADSYRLYLSLCYCEKPVVTGAFSAAGFHIMKDMQVVVRGSEKELARKPLTVFSCCPTSPLKWSHATSENVVSCARYGIPIELVAMPLAGFMAPVTLVGSLVQHTAETLSGLVISQLANPGTPVLYGGSPAVFDVRYETTPMGCVGTMMMDCAYNEIGKHLGMPTQAYIGLGDAKQLDAQAGLESSMGATLAALSGINSISGPGMHDFESCFSLEKLVVDNEIAGMVQRMVQGIEPREDFPSLPHFEELLTEGHLLISDHTRRYLKDEVFFPGPVIDRANRSRWAEEGAQTLGERAQRQVVRLVGEHEPPALSAEVLRELESLMSGAAREHGMDSLPVLT